MNRLKTLLAEARKNNGSTIVGVLAAMVFIGVVVGLMVKNTESQAATSAGYGADMIMKSTVRSGARATESFFLDTLNKAKAISFLNKVKSGDSILHDKAELSPKNQYFSSKIVKLKPSGTNAFNTEFKVTAGKSANKTFKTERAFYRMGNLESPPEAATPPIQNAIFSTSKVNNADAAMTVTNGCATFMDSIEFQNAETVFDQTAYFGGKTKFKENSLFKDKAYFMDSVTFQNGPAVFDSVVYFKGPVEFAVSVTFKQKAYFEKTVSFDKIAAFQSSAPAYFGGDANFSSNATFGNVAQFDKKATFGDDVTFERWVKFVANVEFKKKGTFNGETYFGKKVTLGNGNLAFSHRVCFDGDIDLSNNTITSNKDNNGNKYDVFINGEFVEPVNRGEIRYIGTSDNKPSAYYTLKFQNHTPTNLRNKLVNFDTPQHNSAIEPPNGALSKLTFIKDTIKTPPSIPTPESRRDPQLSTQPIYDAAKEKDGVIIHNAKDVMTTNGSTFDMETLRKSYIAATAQKNTLYLKKYMVIEVTSDITFDSYPPDPFDADIIYIIKDKGKLNAAQKFYSSSATSTSNTLIYVGPGNAQLQQFGTPGIFRGFIYIDEANTASNSVNFPGKGGIVGAIHNFSSKALSWNGGKYSVPITFNADVLKDFGPLYQAKSGSNGTVNNSDGSEITIPSGKSIEVTPLGYYFY